MSIVMQGLVGADPSAKLVALALADFAQVKDHGVAYPSVARLAIVTNICASQVRAHLRELQTGDWIKPEGATHGGRGMATRYRLNLAKMRANMTAKPDDAPSGNTPDKGDDTPAGKEPANAAADHRVNGGLNPMKSGPKPDENGTETRWPAIAEQVEQVITGFTRAPARDVASMRQVLTPLKKGSNAGPEKGGAEKAAPMSQAEQLAYVARMSREGKA